jgi:hypothetical protein
LDFYPDMKFWTYLWNFIIRVCNRSLKTRRLQLSTGCQIFVPGR